MVLVQVACVYTKAGLCIPNNVQFTLCPFGVLPLLMIPQPTSDNCLHEVQNLTKQVTLHTPLITERSIRVFQLITSPYTVAILTAYSCIKLVHAASNLPGPQIAACEP